MEDLNGNNRIKQFEEIIDVLAPCMDDYLYIYDLKGDYYCISPSAVKRFAIPQSSFDHVKEVLDGCVYEADKELLMKDLEQVASGEKAFHNLEYRFLDYSGKPVWINCRGQVLFDKDGRPETLIGCINEIGVKQKADNISGALGETSLEREIGLMSGDRIRGFILRIGIDNFKEINENRGIEYGDMILRRTAECIEAALSPEQKFYRVVADEFVVLDADPAHGESRAVELYKDIRRSLDCFIEKNHYEVFYTISAGVLACDHVDKQHYSNLMKLSEFALNEAKNRGKNQYYIYDKKDYTEFLRKRGLIKTLRQAVNNGCKGFEAYYQPIMDIKQNCLLGAETLLRFSTEELGMLSPAEFIPLLEDSGLIIPVGKWVLDQAMSACAQIQKYMPNFRVTVNLSYIQVLKSNVLNEILAGVEKYQLPKGSLMIELTESGFWETNAGFTKFCEGLQKHGIPLALDDFGTGYSNFHYLYHLSPETIKIDRSFTFKALNNEYEYNLLRHMVEMTHSISLKLCIEGIETDEELQKIARIKPDYIQGYYFGKPKPLKQFLEDHVPQAVQNKIE